MYTKTMSTLRIAAVATIAASIGFGQTSIITVSDPRALAQAVLQLEQRIGIAINYEDVPYAYAGDISDVTAAVMTPAQQAAHPGAHILVPRSGQISVNLAQVPGFGQQSLLSLPNVGSASPLGNAMIAQNASQGLPGIYGLTSSNGAFYVVPTQARDASGAMTNVVPVLSAMVSLPLQERSAGDTLDAILQQVSQETGVKIGLGSAPLNLMISSKIAMSAANEAARSVLGRMFLMLGPQKMPDGSVGSLLAYHLYYDPGLKYYLLNVHKVSPSQSGSAPVQTAAPLIAPTGNPFAIVKK